jgi:hypothetical protein
MSIASENLPLPHHGDKIEKPTHRNDAGSCRCRDGFQKYVLNFRVVIALD